MITWGYGIEYDTGDHNAVAMDVYSQIVDVHVGSNRLFYSYGSADFLDLNQRMTREPSVEYDTGGPNAVAMSQPPTVVEVHVGTGRLFSRVGRLP